MDEQNAYVALNMMDGIGPVTIKALVAGLGSATEIFTTSADAIRKAPGVNPAMVTRILEQRDKVDGAAERARAYRLGLRLLTLHDADYPSLLREIHDPPMALYVQGELLPSDKQAIAVVGTRHATHYGRETADLISYQLAKAGFTVVSGLARGIDTAAHQGALKAGGRTIAVLGSGMDRLYPPENARLAGEIANHGAVISEFPLGREPDKTTFPIRNRIVSGLAMGVLVVEAGAGSGAMHTANSAADQGRHVFAVPGRIDAAGSRGPHRLLKTGARLVESIDDIFQEFEFLFPGAQNELGRNIAPSAPAALLPDEAIIVTALKQGETDIDTLTRACGLTAARISALLIGLEMKRVVRMLPGRRVVLKRHSAG